MSVNGKYKNIKIDDFYEVANRFAIGEAKTIITQVGNSIQKWSSFAKEAEVPEREIKRIEKLLKVIKVP